MVYENFRNTQADDRVPGDKIDDDDDYHYHDLTDSKMWQSSLPHENNIMTQSSFSGISGFE